MATESKKRLDTESDEYSRARAALLEAEIALKEQRETVAALRRKLPRTTPVQDYEFTEGPTDLSLNDPSGFHEVRLSDLFDDPELPLVLIHFMYGPEQESACPMCSMWADGYNATARHMRQRANIAIVVAAKLERIRQWASARGWNDVRLLSSHGTSFKRDFKMEDDSGAQSPGISVFERTAEGTVHHFYTCEAVMSEGHWRGVDLMTPVYNMFDLLPEGRGDWWPSLEYE